MTTNAGAREMDAGSIGFGEVGNGEIPKRDKAMKNFFTPEFRNRLDSIIFFNKLVEANILSIVDKFLFELEQKLGQKKVRLDISDEVRRWLAKVGMDPKMGARPIERAINVEIARPLSQEILFGRLTKGGTVKISGIENDKPIFSYEIGL